MSEALCIAIVGAESTGKTTLALELREALAEGTGLRVAGVDEWLRRWCEQQCRTPAPDEQRSIAEEQQRRIEAAAAVHDIVVCDTTPLMTAVYSRWCFGDTSLDADAVRWHRRMDSTLLMALDLPWVPDGLQRDGPYVREPVDARPRAALARANVPYRVVYGEGDGRLAQALLAINSVAAHAEAVRVTGSFASDKRPWRWACDKCSDPDCEHRLFTGLGLGGANL